MIRRGLAARAVLQFGIDGLSNTTFPLELLRREVLKEVASVFEASYNTKGCSTNDLTFVVVYDGDVGRSGVVFRTDLILASASRVSKCAVKTSFHLERLLTKLPPPVVSFQVPRLVFIE